jgi:hypothetical protein
MRTAPRPGHESRRDTSPGCRIRLRQTHQRAMRQVSMRQRANTPSSKRAPNSEHKCPATDRQDYRSELSSCQPYRAVHWTLFRYRQGPGSSPGPASTAAFSPASFIHFAANQIQPCRIVYRTTRSAPRSGRVLHGRSGAARGAALATLPPPADRCCRAAMSGAAILPGRPVERKAKREIRLKPRGRVLQVAAQSVSALNENR